jgi:Zn-dependent protease
MSYHLHSNKFSFSKIEKKELFKAWFAISIAFTIMIKGNGDSFLSLLLLSGFTVGVGFLLHEIAHKFVAQRYNCIAEFRSDNKMLIIMILLSFMGFLFAAPGAVIIQGNITKKRNGIISLAGPLTNFGLTIIFLIILFFTEFKTLGFLGAQINTFLGLFNLLPFGNIDGKKVLDWNKNIYFIILFVGVILLGITNII